MLLIIVSGIMLKEWGNVCCVEIVECCYCRGVNVVRLWVWLVNGNGVFRGVVVDKWIDRVSLEVMGWCNCFEVVVVGGIVKGYI